MRRLNARTACIVGLLVGSALGVFLWTRDRSTGGEYVRAVDAIDGSHHATVELGHEVRIDFGEVWTTDRFEARLQVHNGTSTDRVIDAIRASCSCTKVEGAGQAVGAGDGTLVVARVDLRWKGITPPASNPHLIEVELAPFGRDRLPLGKWILAFQVREWFNDLPTDWELERVQVLGQDDGSHSLEFHANYPLRDVVVRSDNTSLSATLERIDSQGYYFRLSLDISPEAPLGRFSSLLLLAGTSEQYGPIPERAVRVLGRIEPEVFAPAHTLLLGPSPLNSPRSERLVLRSHSGRAFMIRSCTSADSSLTASAAESSPLKSHAVNISYAPTMLGIVNTTLDVESIVV